MWTPHLLGQSPNYSRLSKTPTSEIVQMRLYKCWLVPFLQTVCRGNTLRLQIAGTEKMTIYLLNLLYTPSLL